MEVEIAKVSEKGQIVIPSLMRKEMSIKKSDQFLVFGEDGTIILKKIEKPSIAKTFDEIANPIREAVKKSGITKKDVEMAVKEARKDA